MDELPNKLVIGIMLVVIASTIITAVAFFNIEYNQTNYIPTEHGSNGRVSIDISQEPSYLGTSASDGKVSIKLTRSYENGQ